MQRVTSLISVLLFASWAAFAAQFRGEDFALPWQSADGTAALVAANAATNGWTSPTLTGKGVSFAAASNTVDDRLSRPLSYFGVRRPSWKARKDWAASSPM